MAQITFRAKPEKIVNFDDSLAYERIKIPAITRSHCDMDSFRRHATFGAYANSDLFSNLIRRQFEIHKIPAYIRLDRDLPACVTVDRSGFLAVVTITL